MEAATDKDEVSDGPSSFEDLAKSNALWRTIPKPQKKTGSLVSFRRVTQSGTDILSEYRHRLQLAGQQGISMRPIASSPVYQNYRQRLQLMDQQRVEAAKEQARDAEEEREDQAAAALPAGDASSDETPAQSPPAPAEPLHQESAPDLFNVYREHLRDRASRQRQLPSITAPSAPDERASLAAFDRLAAASPANELRFTTQAPAVDLYGAYRRGLQERGADDRAVRAAEDRAIAYQLQQAHRMATPPTVDHRSPARLWAPEQADTSSMSVGARERLAELPESREAEVEGGGIFIRDTGAEAQPQALGEKAGPQAEEDEDGGLPKPDVQRRWRSSGSTLRDTGPEVQPRAFRDEQKPPPARDEGGPPKPDTQQLWVRQAPHFSMAMPALSREAIVPGGHEDVLAAYTRGLSGRGSHFLGRERGSVFARYKQSMMALRHPAQQPQPPRPREDDDGVGDLLARIRGGVPPSGH